MTGVPVVDVAHWAAGAHGKARVAKALGDALEQVGFAAIVGHGVPQDLMGRTYAMLKDFFALPLEEKLRSAPPEPAKTRGYLAVGVESVAATLNDERPPDLCEALVFRSLKREAQTPGGVGNIYPERPAALRRQVNDYFCALEALSWLLNEIAAVALGLPQDFFVPFYADSSLTLRFVNYPDQPDPPLPGQLRYGAHHDYGGLTIVRQDDAPGGLQICDADGIWCDVPPFAESFVINVGDLMSRWTNGRWRSTLHRVVNPPRDMTGSTERLSLVMFTGPSADAEIACLPTCCDAAHPPKYEPVRAGAYVRGKIEASMLEVARASG